MGTVEEVVVQWLEQEGIPFEAFQDADGKLEGWTTTFPALSPAHGLRMEIWLDRSGLLLLVPPFMPPDYAVARYGALLRIGHGNPLAHVCIDERGAPVIYGFVHFEFLSPKELKRNAGAVRAAVLEAVTSDPWTPPQPPPDEVGTEGEAATKPPRRWFS